MEDRNSYSRRMALVFNSPYFVGSDAPLERVEELMILRSEAVKAESVQNLDKNALAIVDKAEQSIYDLGRKQKPNHTVKPSPFAGRKTAPCYFTKSEGAPCEKGETAARSGCIPNDGSGSGSPDGSNQPAETPSDRTPQTTVKPSPFRKQDESEDSSSEDEDPDDDPSDGSAYAQYQADYAEYESAKASQEAEYEAAKSAYETRIANRQARDDAAYSAGEDLLRQDKPEDEPEHDPEFGESFVQNWKKQFCEGGELAQEMTAKGANEAEVKKVNDLAARGLAGLSKLRTRAEKAEEKTAKIKEKLDSRMAEKPAEFTEAAPEEPDSETSTDDEYIVWEEAQEKWQERSDIADEKYEKWNSETDELFDANESAKEAAELAWEAMSDGWDTWTDKLYHALQPIQTAMRNRIEAEEDADEEPEEPEELEEPEEPKTPDEMRSERGDYYKRLRYKTKSEGTCKQGERSDLTGCTPASEDPAAAKASVAATEAPAKEPDSKQGMLKKAASKAKAVLSKFNAGIDKVTDRKGLRWIQKVKDFNIKMSVKLYTGMEKRYGPKTAFAIATSAQVLGWGALGVGAVIGVPLYLPGVSFWGTIPAAALAETYLQASNGIRMIAGKSLDEELPQEEIDRLAKEYMQQLQAAFAEYVDANKGELKGAFPQQQGSVKPSPFRKSLFGMKSEGQPCKQGETAEQSDCIPASGNAGSGHDTNSTTSNIVENKPERTQTAVEVYYAPNAQALVKDTMGRDLTDKDIANLVAAPHGAKIQVVSAGAVQGGFSIKIRAKGLTAVRYIKRDEDGSFICKNGSIELDKNQQGKGLGSSIFTTQVKNLSESGFKAIRCTAERDDEMGWNGYYTWARLGYDGAIPERVLNKLPPELAGTKRVQELMGKPGGKEWWKKNGDSFAAEFDLAKDSRSMQIMNAYMAERTGRV